VKYKFIVTPEELLNKVGPVNWVNWFREPSGSEETNRYRWAMEQMQSHFPGKYDLEEAYDPVSMTFKYRLKFLTEADEMWFKLKYE